MGKFYWLKLKRDFFKRHDIKIISKMQDGGEMVLFYLKMLCEAVDHEGSLRFSDAVPYDNDMLASVTDTDKDVVDRAMNILKKLGMVKTDKHGTIIMCGLESMLGSETEWAEKKRQYRTNKGQEEDKKRTMSSDCPRQKRTMSDKSKSKRLEIEKEIEKEIDIEEIDNDKSLSLSSESREIPSLNDVVKFAVNQKINRVIDPEQFFNFYQDLEWKINGKPIKDWKSLLMTWANKVKGGKNVHREITMNELEPTIRDQKWDGVTMPLDDRDKARLCDEDRDRYEKAYLDYLVGDYREDGEV